MIHGSNTTGWRFSNSKSGKTVDMQCRQQPDGTNAMDQWDFTKDSTSQIWIFTTVLTKEQRAAILLAQQQAAAAKAAAAAAAQAAAAAAAQQAAAAAAAAAASGITGDPCDGKKKSLLSLSTNTYLSSYPDGTIWSPTWHSTWETWTPTCQNSNNFCLQNLAFPNLWMYIGPKNTGMSAGGCNNGQVIITRNLEAANRFSLSSNGWWLTSNFGSTTNYSQRGLFSFVNQ